MGSSIRVLCVLSTCGRGGVTRVVETLLPELKQLGLDFEILGQTYNEIGIPIKYPQNVAFTQIRPVSKLPSHDQGQFSFLKKHSQDFVDHALEMEKDFDLIWFFTPFWSLGNADTTPFTKPIVVNIPDFAFDHIGMGDMLNNFFRMSSTMLATRATHTIFSSNFQRYWGESHYGFKSTSVIPYSIYFSPLTEGNDTHPNLPDEYLLAMHPMGHKDPFTLIRGYAYAKKYAQGTSVPPLVLAGLNTDQIDPPKTQESFSLRYEMKHLGLEFNQDVYATGYVEESCIPNLYKNAVAVITATKSEGDLSGTQHEAVLYKRPLIYTDLPVFRDRLIPDEHGLAFSVGDEEALGDCILHVLQYPEFAQKRAGKAFECLSQRTVENVAKEFIDCFERIVNV